MSELKRELMRQVVQPPPYQGRMSDRAFAAVVSVMLASGILMLIGAVLRMCEP